MEDIFLTPARIALVEDNPGDIRLIKEAFSTLTGHVEFLIFSDGQQAIDYMSSLEKDPNIIPHSWLFWI